MASFKSLMYLGLWFIDIMIFVWIVSLIGFKNSGALFLFVPIMMVPTAWWMFRVKGLEIPSDPRRNGGLVSGLTVFLCVTMAVLYMTYILGNINIFLICIPALVFDIGMAYLFMNHMRTEFYMLNMMAEYIIGSVEKKVKG